MREKALDVGSLGTCVASSRVRPILTFVVLGSSIEVATLLTYVGLGRSDASTSLKWLVLVAGATSLLALTWLAARRLTPRQMVAVIAITSGLFGIAYQILAFSMFPGLAKDVDPFTLDQWAGLALIFAVVVAAHTACWLAICAVSARTPAR